MSVYSSNGKNRFTRPNRFELIPSANQTGTLHFDLVVIEYILYYRQITTLNHFGFILLLILRHVIALTPLPVNCSNIVIGKMESNLILKRIESVCYLANRPSLVCR